MGWKKKQKFLNSSAVVLGVLACIPTLIWAIKSTISGAHGETIHNFYGQPLHPVMVLIVFVFLGILLPVIYLKNRKK